MLKRISAGVVFLILTMSCFGQAPPRAGKLTELQKLQSAFNKENQEYYKPYENVKSPEEASKIKLDPKKNPALKYKPKFKALALKLGKSKDGYEAWMMVKQLSEVTSDNKSADDAADAIMSKFLDSPWIGQFAATLPYSYWNLKPDQREKKITAMLLKIEASSKDPSVKASAMYGRAQLIGREGSGDNAAAAKIYRDLIAKYPKTDQAKRAERDIFEAENLSVGKPAPDFQATDENGASFKLSDYKGKVVVLDFWGFW